MSLIAWLPLNESTIKETILNRPITKAGSLELPSYGVVNTTYDKDVGWFGKIGPGYTFKNNGIHMTNISITKAMSFSLWARLSSDCKKCHILDFRDNSGSGIQPMYYGYNDTSKKYGIQIHSDWGGSEYVSAELHDGQWHHVVVTMENGQKACLYIDGTLQGKTNTNMTIEEKDDAYIRIGCRLNGQNPIAGMIQDVRIYNHSLSSREVKELSQALVLHYNFENLGIQQNYFNINEYIKTTAKNNCEVSAYGTNGFVFKSTGNDPYIGTSTHSGGGIGTNITYPILTSTTTQVCISWTHVSGTLELNKNYLTSLNENGQALNSDHVNFGNGTKIGNRRYAIVNLPTGTKKIHVRFGNEALGSGGMIIVDQVSVREGNSYEFIPPSAAQLPSNNTGLYPTYACANLGVSDDAAQGKYAGKFKNTIIQCPFNSNGWEEFTLSAWVKMDPNFTSLSESTACIIVGGLYLCIEPNLRFSTWCYGKNPEKYHKSAQSIPRNQWYHISTVWSKNDVKFYINGILDEVATVSNVIGYANSANHQKKDIGAENSSTNRMFNGLLDDVRIYATALPAEEIYRLAHTKQAIDNKGNEYCSNFTETNTTTSAISSKSIHKLNGLSEIIQLDDGSYWIQVLHHNNRGNKVHFPSSAAENNARVVVNSDGTRHNNNDKSQFCHNLVYVSEDCWSAFPLIAPWTNNNWEFMYIENQGTTDNILVRRWSQTIDPFLAKWEDVTPDSAKVTAISNMPDKRGMYKYHNTNNNGYTYFCIANTASTNWFGAIGSWHEAANGIGHGVGIPNMLDSTSGITDLYVRVAPTKITYKEFKNGIIMPNTINEF